MENNNFKFNDDDFVIGKGFNLEQSQPKSEKKRRKKGKKKGVKILKNLIWIICTLAVSVGLAVVCLRAGADYLGIKFEEGKEVHVQIPEDASIEVISEKLEEAGVIKMPWFFKTYSKIKKYDVRYKTGLLFTLNTELGYAQLADELVSAGDKAREEWVTIPEGTGIRDYVHIVNGEEKTIKGIATLLEEKDVCSKEDFYAALDEVSLNTGILKYCDDEKTYYTLEGYLFPDTYRFYAYDSQRDSLECARMVIQKLIENTESKITPAMYKRAEEMGYTINDILTMASIIQMEAGNDASRMADVASVFYNRLNSDDFKTLGSSPTCYYGYSFGKRDDGRYDTYKIEGLPPGPLCSPGIKAIEAALYPSETSYYYFITDSDGNFYFHKTYDQQLAKEAELKRNGKWVNETFR